VQPAEHVAQACEAMPQHPKLVGKVVAGWRKHKTAESRPDLAGLVEACGGPVVAAAEKPGCSGRDAEAARDALVLCSARVVDFEKGTGSASDIAVLSAVTEAPASAKLRRGKKLTDAELDQFIGLSGISGSGEETTM